MWHRAPDAAAGGNRRRVLARTLAIFGAAFTLWLLIASFYAVDVTEYGVVSRFGHVLRVTAKPGLHLKAPFDSVLRVDRRLLLFRPEAAEFLSEDKKNIVVDSLVTWRVTNPQRYLETLGTIAAAEQRLADIVEGEIGAVLGRYESTSFITPGKGTSRYDVLIPEIRDRAARLADQPFGIALVDVDIRRLSLPELNKEHVFDRMKAERGRIAKEYRSAGDREAKRIIAEADHQRTDIESEAYAKAERIKAAGDAEAARTYVAAFSRDPRFYKFLSMLQAYQQFLDDKTTLFLPANAAALGILRYELSRPPGEAAAPAGNLPAAHLPAAAPANAPRAETAPGSPQAANSSGALP
jgi:modulator of FtsH protease HflC